MLRRDGIITAWYDREIKAGDVIDNEVSAELERAELFLALVSPDFLNSNYCYEKEMTRAIERHAAGEMRIVPIIVEPCDWRSSPLERFKALPRDGKPISEWANQNNAFVDVVTELRRVAVAEPEGLVSNTSAKETPTGERKYRVKRQFDDVDKADFRRAAFDVIKTSFEEWIQELDAIEGIKARFESMGAISFTCMVLNQNYADRAAHVTVRAKAAHAALGDIYYSFAERAAENTANGSFDIQADDYDLFLRYQGFGPHSLDKRKLSPGEAAELLWTEFLEQAGVSHA